MKNFLKRIYPFIAPNKSYVVISLILSLVLAAIKGAQVKLIRPIFDQGLSEQASWEEVLLLAGILLGLGVINFPTRFFHFYLMRFAVDRATCRVREKLYEKICRLPLSFFSESRQGELLSNLGQDTEVYARGLRASVDLVREPLAGLTMLGIAFYTDWKLSFIVLFVAPIFIFIFKRTGIRMKANQGEVQEELGNMTHALSEGIAGQKLIKSFNLQKFVRERFEKIQGDYFLAKMKTVKTEEMGHPLVELVGAFAFTLVILFAHQRIQEGAMSPGDFVSFVAALALFMDPVRKFSQANVLMSQSRAAGERIYRLLDLAEEKNRGSIHCDSFKRAISVRNLSFSYAQGGPVLKNLNFEIKKGERVAFVGPSGSGKSTLVHLLLHLYSDYSGEILIDGVSARKIDLFSLRSLFGLVNQDVFLFNTSVYENLTLGDKDLTESSLERALSSSYASDFVSKLEEGIETVIGDRGVRLSGGQKQRITIARAYLRNPEIFLFDEATSALDNESEKIIQRALSELSKDRTVVAVAHRLSTIQHFDRIYYLQAGEILEAGNHSELMTREGAYYRLFELGELNAM